MSHSNALRGHATKGGPKQHVGSRRRRADLRRGVLRRRPDSEPLRPTLGPQVCRWMEANLIHGEGDYFGQPFKLRAWQRAFVYRCYELNPDGTRIVKEALLGLPKGNGKTELAAAICWVELAGPVVFDRWAADGRPIGKRRLAPNIPVAAASFEQADKVFGAARMMAGPTLREYFDIFDVEILSKNVEEPARMYRVAAVAGTNDGGLPTFFCADELHEWIGKKKRVHTVLANGIAKRKGGWTLNISTAGWDITSLLGRMVIRGKRIREGKAPADPKFLFEWHEYVEPRDKNGNKIELDFSNKKKLAAAIREANPAADDFLDVEERIMRLEQDVDEHEFRRYYLNQWATAPDSWLAPGVWEACADREREVPDTDARIVLVLDGQYDGQSTGIVGATVDDEKPHLFVLRSWEKQTEKTDEERDAEEEGNDENRGEWRVTLTQIEQEIRDLCAEHTVLMVGMDPSRWRSTLTRLEEEGLPVIAYETHLASRMVPACTDFKEALSERGMTHDGNERMARHFDNAMVRIDSRGPRIVKEHDKSERHIDLAVAAVAAFDLAKRQSDESGDDFRPQ